LDELTVKPVEGNKKVFLVSDFADATPQAQNKLLKALEEPPENVFFLLGATSSYPVLTTVLSRTEKLEIQPFDAKSTEECLKRIYGEKYSPSEYSLCAGAANGSLGTAQNMLDGGFFKDLIEKAFALTMSEFTTLPTAIKKLGDTKYKRELLSLLKLVYRDAFLLKAKTEERGFGYVNEGILTLPTEKHRTEKLAERFSLATLLYAQTALTNAEKEVKFNANFLQCIEIALSEILWHERKQ
jgi:DNA polymerase-3 subunit delta'